MMLYLSTFINRINPFQLHPAMSALAAFYHPDWLEAGCDEAGRGCLAGPVYAAAVVLSKDFYHPWLNDSKQMTESQRATLRPIIETEALAWAVGRVEAGEIDEINILRASFLAMHRALDQLSLRPEHILVDGNRFVSYASIPHQCIIQGDGKFMAIAAASVLAKTHRDAEMHRLQHDFPQYHWHSNKGYPTEQHRQAIREHGISPYHRRSFQLLPVEEQLTFF